MNKTILRKHIQKIILSLSEGERKRQEEEIVSKISAHIKKTPVSTIAVYESLKDEVSTDTLIEHLLQVGKRVLIPKIISQTEMEFIDIQNGLRYEENINVCLVPGRAFTVSGVRLGRGQGYYDRFLSKYPDIYTIGLCYREQIFGDISQEKHDIKMDEIITFNA